MDDGSSFLSRHFDFLDSFGDAILQRGVLKEKLTVAEDYAKKIVKIVSDAAGQAPDGFHFLRLDELLLEIFGTLLFLIALLLRHGVGSGFEQGSKFIFGPWSFARVSRLGLATQAVGGHERSVISRPVILGGGLTVRQRWPHSLAG